MVPCVESRLLAELAARWRFMHAAVVQSFSNKIVLKWFMVHAFTAECDETCSPIRSSPNDAISTFPFRDPRYESRGWRQSGPKYGRERR
jgi:hypothetical protein